MSPTPALAATHGSALIGLQAQPIEVEATIAQGVRSFDLVGLPHAAVRESAVRVRSALESVGFSLPAARVTVGLMPVDARKDGSGLDLAMACAVLAAADACPGETMRGWMLVGELSLTGAVRHVRGAGAMVLRAKQAGLRGVIVPADNAAEAAAFDGIDVRAAGTLAEVLAFFRGEHELVKPRSATNAQRDEHSVDFADVRGQSKALRALEIAAAGGHSVLMIGPPGAGKTLLARALPTIMPRMTQQESIEVTNIYSISGLLRPGVSLVDARPFRCPHYTASAVGISGGGDPPRPGEATLAHHGVLFLDEVPEFSGAALETVRDAVDDEVVQITRSRVTTTFPAVFTLVGAMMTCPCGFRDDATKPCRCSAESVSQYRARASLLLNRFDLRVRVRAVDLSSKAPRGPSSEIVRQRVSAARAMRRDRKSSGDNNARMDAGSMAVEVSDGAILLLEAQFETVHMRVKAIRIARTIADLAGESCVSATHAVEAIGYHSSAP